MDDRELAQRLDNIEELSKEIRDTMVQLLEPEDEEEKEEEEDKKKKRVTPIKEV